MELSPSRTYSVVDWLMGFSFMSGFETLSGSGDCDVGMDQEVVFQPADPVDFGGEDIPVFEELRRGHSHAHSSGRSGQDKVAGTQDGELGDVGQQLRGAEDQRAGVSLLHELA